MLSRPETAASPCGLLAVTPCKGGGATTRHPLRLPPRRPPEKRRHREARATGRDDLRSPQPLPVRDCRVALRAPRSEVGRRMPRPETAASLCALLAVTPCKGCGATTRHPLRLPPRRPPEKRRHREARATGRDDLRSPQPLPLRDCRVALRAPRSEVGRRMPRPETAASLCALIAVTRVNECRDLGPPRRPARLSQCAG